MTHYTRWYKYKDPGKDRKYQHGNAQKRFYRFMNKSDGCWLWKGFVGKNGYGQFTENSKTILAHRWSYENSYGKIRKDREIDHLCRNRGCVNPNHLEAVTCKENIRRGETGKWQRDKTHCPSGHSYELAYVRPNGHRSCRICNKERMRKKCQANG